MRRSRRETSAKQGPHRAWALLGGVVAVLASSCDEPPSLGTPGGGSGNPGDPAELNANRLAIGLHSPTFGYDPGSGRAAFEFPAQTSNHVLAGAGLWMAAQVNGELRASITGRATDYAYGHPDSAPEVAFRAFKVNSTDAPDSPAVQGWPVELGAPVDTTGAPAVPADGQIAWTLYHDTDPSRHTLLSGDGLGALVRQSLEAVVGPPPLDRTAVVRFEVENIAEVDWSAAYFGFWVDAELGGAFDDVCGSDATQAMVYVYNRQDEDADYLLAPPAAGVAITSVSTGDTLLPATRTTNIWSNGLDPQSVAEVLNLLTAKTTAGEDNDGPFLYPGDPATGSGQLDQAMGDKRMMVCIGPYNLAAGQTLTIEGVICAAFGTGVVPRTASVTELKADFRAAVDMLRGSGAIR